MTWTRLVVSEKQATTIGELIACIIISCRIGRDEKSDVPLSDGADTGRGVIVPDLVVEWYCDIYILLVAKSVISR